MTRDSHCPKEKRKFIRLDAEYVLCHAKFSIDQPAARRTVKGIVKNYSLNGVLFESTVPYKIGDLVKLDITMPGWEQYKSEFYKDSKLSRSEPIVILASVVRYECIRPDELYDIGACFLGIDEGHRLALLKLIDEELKK